MNKIFYIMGKSASGKDKIYNRLLDDEALGLHRLILYTTRPIRVKEEDGKEYFFVNDEKFREFKVAGKVIETRSYDTVMGMWTYFTVDDGQINLDKFSYLGIGTLESYEKMVAYFGQKALCPLYIEVEDGERLRRAIQREGKQEDPHYAEVCRRFLADTEDFSQENINKAHIDRYFENIDFEKCIKEISDYIRNIK